MIAGQFADSRFGSAAVVRLRAAFAQRTAPMLLVDDRRRCITGNAAACNMLGYTLDELPWHVLDEFASAAELPVVDEQWASLVAHGALEGWYWLEVPGSEGPPIRIEATATANVLPSRHLVMFIPSDGAVEGEGNGRVANTLDWHPVAIEPDRNVQLTKREREIMTMVAHGMRSSEIADTLFLAPETVKSHVSNAMGKLGSHTRAGAVTIALVTGQIAWEV